MNTSLLIGDIVKWLVVAALLVVVFFYSFIGIFYTFEFFLTKILRFDTFLYLVFWSFIFSFAVPLFTFAVTFVVSLVSWVVRQKHWYLIIVSTLYFLVLVALLIAFWFSFGQFGWEMEPRHQTLNKWLYSFFLLAMFGIPYKIFNLITTMRDETVD